MNKIVIGVIVVLVLAVAGAGVYLMQNLDGIVKELVEQAGTDATKTQVRVKAVKVNLAEGEATLSGLTVANPAGFSAEPLLTLGNILVSIDTASLTGPVYVINSINVDGVRVLAEQKGSTTNVQALLDGMSSEESGEGDGNGTASSDIKLAIGTINFSGGTMELRSEQLGSQEVNLKDLNLRNVGTPDNGLTPDEVSEEIARQVILQVRDAVKAALASYLRKEAASKLKEKLGSFFNRDED